MPRAVLWLICAFCTFPATSAPAAAATFDAGKAEQTARAFERSYRADYEAGPSQYYGRLWANVYARKTRRDASRLTVWQQYLKALAARRKKPRRLDCTLYAQAILRAGMSPDDYERLRRAHDARWKGRGFAGWSIAHLLTTQFGWKAVAIIHRSASYHSYYLHHFRKKRVYPVWKQPDIRIEQHFVLGRDDARIERLLKRHRFGWGFSDGGIHTWITLRDKLKECHWDRGPSRAFEIPVDHFYYPIANLRSQRLFKTTRLIRFTDYGAHLVVFPPPANSTRLGE